MSVEIYDVSGGDAPSEIMVPVASEKMFESVWTVALRQLGIGRLGNGVWLHRDELDLLLADLRRVEEWVKYHCTIETADNIIWHIDHILKELPRQWGEHPDTPRLWMG